MVAAAAAIWSDLEPPLTTLSLEFIPTLCVAVVVVVVVVASCAY